MYKLLEQYWQAHRKLFVSKKYWGHIIIGSTFCAIAMLLCLGSKEILETMVSTPLPPSPDFLLDRIPSLYTYGIASLGPWITAVLCVWFSIKYPRKVPFILYTLGVLYSFRTIFIQLTPLGARLDRPIDAATNIFNSITYGGYDFFFSGHTAFPFVLLLIFWKDKAARWIFGILTPIIGLSTLFEKIHYSIDVVAAPFIVYGVYGICKKIWREDF